MTAASHTRLQFVVFALVGASFANIYLTQPVLPVLQEEFATDTVTVSFSVSAVLLGIALANLPFGFLADRLSIRPIILAGGCAIALGGLVCSLTHDLRVLIGARFFQGIFIPALTTCLAAYLAKTLPLTRLNVVMGSYVAATVLGGMLGRLLGGFMHPPLHWRYAFVSAGVLVLVATVVAMKALPGTPVQTRAQHADVSFLTLLTRWELWLAYLCGAAGQAVFSPVFNYMPYRLGGPPFNLSIELTTLVYLVYLVGIFMGPGAGRISNRFGTGPTLIAGAVVLGLSLALLLVPAVTAVVIALVGVCAGFFTIHAASVGSLNRRVAFGQGRANALYVLFYYLGAWLGITWAGFAYQHGGWNAVVGIGMLFVIVPLAAGIIERNAERKSR